MITSAQQSIARQRDALAIFLEAPLMELASVCVRVWDDTDALEDALRVGLTALPYCDATGETGWKARRLPERTFRLAGPAIDRPRCEESRAWRQRFTDGKVSIGNSSAPVNWCVGRCFYAFHANDRPWAGGSCSCRDRHC